MSLKNQSNQKRYVFPARAVLALQADAEGDVGKTLSLHWRPFIEAANKKAPLDEETFYALDLLSQIQFRLSAEAWRELEAQLSHAEYRSEKPGTFVFSCGRLAHEIAAATYFDAMYALTSTSSQAHPHTLCMIAKYLFAVRNIPVDRAFKFATHLSSLLPGDIYNDRIADNPHRQLHNKAVSRIKAHWNAWRDAEKASEQVEYAQAPEAPIQPAEPLETPDMDALMRRALAEFEEGKPLTEAGRAICDAFGLREVYEEQLKDPKNRAILAIGETILRALQTVLRPPTTPEKPFVMSTPVVPPTQAPSNSMSDVVKGMIEKQQQREAAKKAEIDAAYRQRDEQIRQAKAIADAECQDALDRISRGYAKGEEGVWLPLVGHGQRGPSMAQILADLKAKADEQHELSEKIRERFSDKGENFVAQLRRHIVYDGSKSN